VSCQFFTARCIGPVLSCGVWLSVTLLHCVEIMELIIKQLALDCRLWTLVYDTKHGERCWKVVMSHKYVVISHKLYKIETKLIQNSHRNLYPTYLLVQFPMTLIILYPDFKDTSIARYLCDSWASCDFHCMICGSSQSMTGCNAAYMVKSTSSRLEVVLMSSGVIFTDRSDSQV